jgi:hypothetical protein
MRPSLKRLKNSDESFSRFKKSFKMGFCSLQNSLAQVAGNIEKLVINKTKSPPLVMQEGNQVMGGHEVIRCHEVVKVEDADDVVPLQNSGLICVVLRRNLDTNFKVLLMIPLFVPYGQPTSWPG